MSSRALRRLQREQEEAKQLEALQKEEGNLTDTDEEGEDVIETHLSETKSQRNAFDFLNAEEEEDIESEDEPQKGDLFRQPMPSENATASSKKSKKAKKKKKKPTKAPLSEPGREQDLDEIDRALKSLRTEDQAGTEVKQGVDPGLRSFYQILSTDSKHLNPLNEMKKLFGSAVLDGDRENTGNRRRGRGPTHLDLGAALTGRHSQVSRGQSLAGLALRRNVFMVGKEEWPKATSGGLGMEIVEEASDFTIEYRFVHTSMYQSIQRQFDLCVESMDPQRMISHLQLNPYHISTLLQVSEIAKQQGDHAVAVDLLERALFTFGRSVQSSFATSMASGRARLDFRRPENREFWLAAYRYIGTLGQRGTWRTAFEWAKLLLSLDPEQDPYCVRLIIDQLALRGAQYDTLVKLAETSPDVLNWGQTLPNIQISLAMSYYKLKQPEKARSTLQRATLNHPWILANLCKELNLEPVPKAVWGRQPRTTREELFTLCYGLRAKDIWNTPEAVSFLKSVIETESREEPLPAATDPEEKDLSLAECRHVMLSEIPTLMAVLPREVANYSTSASDPLPPPDNKPSYSFITPEPTRDEWENELDADRFEAGQLRSWFGGILQRLGITLDSNADESNTAAVEQVATALETSGMDINEIALRTSRMEELRDRQAIAERRLRELEQGLQGVAGNNENESTPNLEDISNLQPTEPSPSTELAIHAPQQASVEDVSDDDYDFSSNRPPPPQPQPLMTPTPTTSSSSNSNNNNNANVYDDEANQRWLAGRGMLSLKAFVAEHGSDETRWKDDLDVDISPATEYAHRITLLRNKARREFMLNYALAQGAGKEASELVRRLLA